MRKSLVLALAMLLPGAMLQPRLAWAQERPEWAFGPDTSGIAYPRKPDDGVLKQVPGSTKRYTQAQIDDPMHPPDWFPDEHPPMPRVVAEGNGTTVRACIGCHLANGHGHPENSRLPGSSAVYLKRQLEEFRVGKRQGPASLLMNNSAKHLTDDEITAATDYFSKLNVVPWTRVVESDSVPKTWWRGNRRLQLADGGTEPIGHQLVEVPEDPARTALRDPHSGTVTYAPPGSLARGQVLVTSGGDGKALGKTLACASCHGPALHGTAEIPNIAGQHSIVIARQLFAFKAGDRDGAMAALMRPVVEKLTEDDIIAIAAYVASQNPVGE
jgi:cytochrome c553